MDDIAAVSLPHRQAALPKNAQHGHVSCEHISLELIEAVCTSDPDHVPQKGARKPAALVILLDKKGEFRALRRSTGVQDNVTGPADDHLVLRRVDRDKQRGDAVKVRRGDPGEFSLTKIGFIPEESSIDGFSLKIMECTAYSGAIVGPGRPHRDDRIVTKSLTRSVVARNLHNLPFVCLDVAAQNSSGLESLVTDNSLVKGQFTRNGQLRRSRSAVSCRTAFRERVYSRQSLARHLNTRKVLPGSLTAQVAGQPGAPPLLAGTGKDDTHLIVVATSDRGLAGGLNATIVREAPRRQP
jgi:hypothetical protein